MSSRIEHHAGPASEASSAALKEIGHLLRETRQARGEDLYDVADYLRIKPSYLFAIEDGDLSLTPGRVYALGFLRSYGEHLGFDGEELVGYAKQAISGAASRPQLNYPAPAPESRRPGGILIAASILAVGLIYGGWRMLYQDQPVLERVSAVPGDIGRLASQVFTLGDEGGTGPAPDGNGASSVATSATAATPPADGTAPLAPAAADPESALASTPQPPIAPSSTAVGPQAQAAPALAIDAQAATREGRVASAGETTRPATSAAAATPAAATPGTPDPLTAAPSAGQTGPLRTSAASTPVAASAADPVAAASATSADGGGARALLASLDSAGSASGGAAAAPAGASADDRVVLVASRESWVQVRSRDRQYVRTWTLQAGERFTVPDRSDLALWTGNAGGLDVLVDGRNLGALGADGHVMRDVPLTAEALRARLSASR